MGKNASDGLIERQVERARLMRKVCSEAERVLWRCLRRRNIEGVHFRRQHPFGPYILDFYCSERSLAIEADGDSHFTPDAIAHDARRSRFLAERGLRVLRFTNVEVLQQTQSVLDAIWRALRAPSP